MEKRYLLSRGNIKVSERVGIFNLPSIKSCLNCKDCHETCYSKQREIMFPNVRERRDYNLNLVKTNLCLFKEKINKQVTKQGLKIVRIHESGDFINEDYIEAWRDLAVRNPDVRFYGYTKTFSIFKRELERLNKLNNVNIINSYINGKRNYGNFKYVTKLVEEEKAFLCPAKGCMESCTYCLDGDKPVFLIHGTYKNKDKYVYNIG